jgi:ATP-dependent Lon protease
VLDFVSRDPFMVARIELHPEPTLVNPEIEARALRLRELAIEALQLLPQAPRSWSARFRASTRFRRWRI